MQWERNITTNEVEIAHVSTALPLNAADTSSWQMARQVRNQNEKIKYQSLEIMFSKPSCLVDQTNLSHYIFRSSLTFPYPLILLKMM